MVSIIIPHYNGRILLDCLSSIFNNTEGSFEVSVVDDGSDDRSIGEAQARFPRIRVIRNQRNLGFAVSCNRGIEVSRGRYLILLNNDTQVQPGWLSALVTFADAHENAGACQPKILSAQQRDRFDYSGGAGGLIDLFGYPYCLGRVFDELEKDQGQYDEPREIFWASGTAMLLRREALEVTGLLDEGFFMHFEEIDLCWRLHLAGFEVWSVPTSVVYHHSGWTLPPQSLRKMYLNHRNSLVSLLKNYAFGNLIWIFPLRFGLELLTIEISVLKLDWKRAIAPLGGTAWVVSHLGDIWHKRQQVQRIRKVSDRKITGKMLKGSIALRHFLSRIPFRYTSLK